MSQFPFPVVPYWLTPREMAATMTACADDGPHHAQHLCHGGAMGRGSNLSWVCSKNY